jgi:ubiquinone/menaquinone biosynthesis C-methylase UbiE
MHVTLHAQLSDGLRVLDFGCGTWRHLLLPCKNVTSSAGTGYISAAAALLVGSSGSVDAVDVNSGALLYDACDV